ncbi:hypothetical protein SISNIDRAFT_403998 [Sistotremastrum niveocremeum HHB9708]|uniref:Uncharacterized protein n=2 Tax=Sistotremastraceae TaxID=3402574 RepID=A0A165A1E2_9AGAM|nr:hypothetical protein SISNIDRAFT_403998 [Sistotremastrum niveocremeum HHB9708]KZT41505.1 hypothetical protein SISSUDRAFT_981765 [Sistotremastrum suecicum HHB10207 ss-3]
MSLVFTAPSHARLIIPDKSFNPHSIPAFASDDDDQRPIIYLPPLLSSLPPKYPKHGLTSAHTPLHTDTHLPDIDPVSLSLHRALHHFRPLNDNYASVPYATAFNWSELELPLEDEREWYIVAFRSARRHGSDGDPLYAADKLAHEEAVQNGGLIMYWYGLPNPETGMNLATCIWQSRRHALAAISGPHHSRAMKLAHASFSTYSLERHVLRKTKGERHVRVEEYHGGEVGW